MMTVPDADTTRKLKHRRTLPVANKANLVPPFRLQRIHHSPRQAGRLDSPPPAHPTSAPAEFTSPSPVKPTFVSPAEQQGGASRKVEFVQNVDHFGSQKWDHFWSQKWDQKWSHFLPRFVKTESGHIGNPITARQRNRKKAANSGTTFGPIFGTKIGPTIGTNMRPFLGPGLVRRPCESCSAFDTIIHPHALHVLKICTFRHNTILVFSVLCGPIVRLLLHAQHIAQSFSSYGSEW